jgi:magnesium-transporting ATPase (P-type)
VVEGSTLDALTDDDLDRLLDTDEEIVFARAAPEVKLRIADALRHEKQVVAMTGDGVNDAPALRRADENVIDRSMLLRAWGLMGVVSAALTMGLFFLVLGRAGWTPGAPTADGSPLHHVYLLATTASFAAIVACQIGTAFAARTQHSSLRRIGMLSNPLLLGGSRSRSCSPPW